MQALVTELGAIQTREAASAVVVAMMASLHHEVRWDDELHVHCVCFKLFFWHLKLTQQVFSVFKNGLTEHAVEALREAEAEVRTSDRFKVPCARQTVAKTYAV